MFEFNENYNANGSILGLIRFNMKGISGSQAKWFLFGIMVLNVAALFGAAWLFQIFWAWFIPAVIPMLPHAISYWHAFASVFLMVAFMSKSGKD